MSGTKPDSFKTEIKNFLKFHQFFLIIFVACSTWQGYERVCRTECFSYKLHIHTYEYRLFSNYETHKSFWDFKNTKPLICHKYTGILILTKVEMKQTDPQYWLTQLPKFNSW